MFLDVFEKYETAFYLSSSLRILANRAPASAIRFSASLRAAVL